LARVGIFYGGEEAGRQRGLRRRKRWSCGVDFAGVEQDDDDEVLLAGMLVAARGCTALSDAILNPHPGSGVGSRGSTEYSRHRRGKEEGRGLPRESITLQANRRRGKEEGRGLPRESASRFRQIARRPCLAALFRAYHPGATCLSMHDAALCKIKEDQQGAATASSMALTPSAHPPGWPNTKLPDTSTFAPASDAILAVPPSLPAADIPPSTLMCRGTTPLAPPSLSHRTFSSACSCVDLPGVISTLSLLAFFG
jgi:hypothetical protein